MRTPFSPAMAVVLVALGLVPPPAARGEDPSDRPAVEYVLPPGVSSEPALTAERRALVEAAAATLVHARTADDAREGWRVLAAMGAEAAPAAVRALGRADWFGRALLVRGLGSMQDARLLPLLETATRDPAWAVRETAAEGLGLALDGRAVPALLPLLADDAWRVRETAVRSLRRLALRGALTTEAATAHLLPLADDADLDVRLETWLALADLRRPEAAAVLLPALRDLAERARPPEDQEPGTRPDPTTLVALRVLRGLVDGHGDDAALADLLWELTEEPSAPLAGHFLREWFLLRNRDEAPPPEAVRRVVRAFRGRGSTEFSRAPAERTLVELGDAAVEALVEVLSEPARPTRIDLADDTRVLLDLVVRIEGDRAPAILEPLLRNESIGASTRVHAAGIARRLFAKEMVAVFRELYDARQDPYALQEHMLRGLADGGDPDARRIVAEALVRGEGEYPPSMLRLAAAGIMETRADLRDVAAVERALDRENDGDALARLLALLREGGGEEAVARIARFFSDDRAKVRRRAGDALSRVPGPRTVEVLLARLREEDGEDAVAGLPQETHRDVVAASLRTSLVSSLRMAAGEEAVPVLTALLDDPRPEVRGAAADNLATLADPAASLALARRVDEETRHLTGPDADPAALGLRQRLLSALFCCGGPDASTWVSRTLLGDDADLRDLVLEELGTARARIDAGDAVATVIESTVAGSFTRLLALKALAGDRSSARAALLLRLLEETGNFEEKRQVLGALGRTGDATAVAPVAALIPRRPLDETDPEAFATAVQAVETLGDLGRAEATPTLSALLGAVLPEALAMDATRRTEPARQLAAVALRALGHVEGPAALDVLVEAAFQPGFSRAAELTTREGVEFLHGGDPPEPRLPPGTMKRLATTLAGALQRTRDAALEAAIEKRLARLREDGRAYALSEEWLSWLGRQLGSPPDPHPYRPRWRSRMALLRQVVENAPRDSSLDRAARYLQFQNASEVFFDADEAERRLADWRRLYGEQDPYAADEDRKVMDGFLEVLAMARAWKAGDEAAARARFAAAMAVSEGDARVPRLAGEILVDLSAPPDFCEEAALAAVQGSPHWPPHHRLLGRARLAAGDAAGAVEPLQIALDLARKRVDRVSWRESYNAPYLYYLARAYAATDRTEEALDLLGQAMSLNDQYMDWAPVDDAFKGLRDHPRFPELLRRAQEKFDEVPTE